MLFYFSSCLISSVDPLVLVADPERRVSDLKKKLLNVVAATDAANAALDEAKRAKEVAERELRGSQVQLSMCDATIQAQLVFLFSSILQIDGRLSIYCTLHSRIDNGCLFGFRPGFLYFKGRYLSSDLQLISSR